MLGMQMPAKQQPMGFSSKGGGLFNLDDEEDSGFGMFGGAGANKKNGAGQ